MPPDAPLRIDVAGPAQQAAALMLLLVDEPEASRLEGVARLLKSTRHDPQRFDQLLVACRGACLVGTIWGQELPGRTAVLWPPRLLEGESDQTADALLAELDRRLRGRVRVIQAILRKSGEADGMRLRRQGYEGGVDLLYLLGAPLAAPATSQAPLRFTGYSPDQRQRMARLIEATYQGTQDVPQLNSVRAMDDVLEGYQQTGVFDPSLWFFVEKDGREQGCLLLADHPQDDQWELVYMGLKPEARGRGWGQTIVRFAQGQLARSGRSRLVVAVDAANEPAVRTYARAGFWECDRRTVFLKILEPCPLSQGRNHFRHEGCARDA